MVQAPVAGLHPYSELHLEFIQLAYFYWLDYFLCVYVNVDRLWDIRITVLVAGCLSSYLFASAT